jgi:hypothetical protein
VGCCGVTDRTKPARTVACSLCGRDIVLGPQSHVRLAHGHRSYLDCFVMSRRAGYVRPGVHLVRVCRDLGCEEPGCYRWTHFTVTLDRPKPGAVETPPPFALAVDERPDCEDCAEPMDGNPPFMPNYDGRFRHIGCVMGNILYQKPRQRPLA